MSYFSADERLERCQTLPPAPYNLRLVEMDERSAEVSLAWQRPLGRVEGYLVLVQSSKFKVQSSEETNSPLNSQEVQEWHTVVKLVGREKCGARVQLPPEIWGATPLELAVVSYVGEALSEPSAPLVLPPRLRIKLEVRSQKSEVVEHRGVSQEQTLPTSPESVGAGSTRENQGSESEAVGAGLTRDNSQTEPAPAEPAPELAGWAEIEEALRRNSALLGRHGLFVNRNR